MARYGNRTKTVSATTSAGLEVKLRLTLGAGGDVTVHIPKDRGGWTKNSWFHAAWSAKRAFQALYFPGMAQAATEALETLEEQRHAHLDALRAERESTPEPPSTPDPGPEVTEVIDREGDRWYRSGDGWLLARTPNSQDSPWSWNNMYARYGPLTWIGLPGTSTRDRHTTHEEH